MLLFSRRFIALVLVLTFAVAAPAFARRRPPIQNSDADTVVFDAEYARTETYRYPALELFLMATRQIGEMNLSLHCSFRASAMTAPGGEDFKLKVIDDRHEEVPCKLNVNATGSSPNFALISYAMALKPGHIPATASVWFQGYEHVFTFKLKGNEPIK
jgi:hypothetical protein